MRFKKIMNNACAVLLFDVPIHHAVHGFVKGV
jgi:hypothetical protein